LGKLNISATITDPEPDDTIVVFLPRGASVRAPTNELDEGDVWRSAEVADLENGVQVQIPVSTFAEAGLLDGGFDFSWTPLEVRPLGIDRAQMVVRYSMFFRVVRKTLDRASGEPGAGAQAFTWRPLPRTAEDGTESTVSIELRLPDPNDRFEETSPTPASLSFRSRRWDAPVSNEMVIEVVAENEWTRRQLDLARNVLFLLLGVFIAELPRVLPRLRSRA
jgi:hypothetical protein